MKVFYMKAHYGRQEMTVKCLVAANSLIKARRLANEACPVPCFSVKNDIKGYPIKNLTFETKKPIVICKI